MNCSRIVKASGCVIRQVVRSNVRNNSLNLTVGRYSPNVSAIRWSSTDTKEPSAAKAEEKVSEPAVDDLGDVIPPGDLDAEKILSLEKEVRDLKDRVVRSLAEEENVR